MKFKYCALLGMALAGLAASSQAAYVQVRFDNPIFSGVPTPAYDNLTIAYPQQVGGGSASAGVAAGRFQGTVLAFDGVDANIFVDNLNDLFMYCYDLYDHIGSGWVVNYTINPDGEQARTLDFLGAVNAVVNQGKTIYDQFAWLHPGSGAVAAAIQLGIWESRYDTGAWNIASGSFSATGVDAATQGALNGFFGAIDSSAALDGKYVMTLVAAGAQDMVTGDPPGTVPEPGTLALFGIALAGLVSARRRPGASSTAA